MGLYHQFTIAYLISGSLIHKLFSVGVRTQMPLLPLRDGASLGQGSRRVPPKVTVQDAKRPHFIFPDYCLTSLLWLSEWEKWSLVTSLSCGHCPVSLSVQVQEEHHQGDRGLWKNRENRVNGVWVARDWGTGSRQETCVKLGKPAKRMQWGPEPGSQRLM